MGFTDEVQTHDLGPVLARLSRSKVLLVEETRTPREPLRRTWSEVVGLGKRGWGSASRISYQSMEEEGADGWGGRESTTGTKDMRALPPWRRL